MTNLFYLQDSRSNVGSFAMWWAKEGKGYTTNLDHAEQYTLEQAVKHYEWRETDLPWPMAYIDARSTTGVDFQYVDKESAAEAAVTESRFYSAFQMEWDGNDMVWQAAQGGSTANLEEARTFSAGHVVGLAARGYWPLPVGYIDSKSRRRIATSNLSHKDALRGAGVKLKKIKPQKSFRDSYRCEPCGRFLTRHQNYTECPNCFAENRP